jgi:hypothetical protein
MNNDTFERKLAAIFYADVAGYSRLTGADEEGTHRRLSEYLDVISAAIKNHRGRVVHYAGDAVLADFSTVTDALSCAAAIQQDLAARNHDLPDERQVQFRIGVNLGEVINIAKPVRAYRVVAAGEADRVPPACPYSGMVPGGTQIVMGVLQATLNVLDHTITMTKAVIVFSLRTRR